MNPGLEMVFFGISKVQNAKDADISLLIPHEKAMVMEVDEMWHYLQKKPTGSGFGRLIVAIPVTSLTENAAIVMERHSSV